MIFFESVAELVQAAKWEEKTISRITLEQTALDMGISEEAVFERMASQYQVMKEAVSAGAVKDGKSLSGLTGDMAYKMKESADGKRNFSGGFMGKVIAYALAVSESNAGMGKVVAAPTAGSCGIIPGCLVALQETYEIPDEKMVMGLLNASGIGMVIAKNASISGAECGCQAECGSAAAMAASAMVEILGGTPEACSDAAAQALKCLMGLVCDPVAGLVEEPCIVRNPASCGVAVVAAELSLAGIPSIIPCDEVVETMKTVGGQMPSCLRETAQGGIAVSETGKKLSERILNG